MFRYQGARALTLFCMLSTTAKAVQEHDIAALRAELEQIRQHYQARIDALEQRLAVAELRIADAHVSADTAQQLAAGFATGPTTTNARDSNAFNPAIGTILVGTYAELKQSRLDTPGFQFGGEGLPAQGLSLGESELNLNANVDDKFFANLTFALADEDGAVEVEVEEAWLQTTALPANLRLTAGRLFSGLGYLNGFHRHVDDFIDRPLPYQAFLGEQYIDDGIQLRWLAPTTTFLEFGAEAMRGDKFPGGADSDGQEIFTAFVKTGGDIGLSHAWQAGASYLDANVTARTDEDMGEAFSGDSDLYSLEFVYKWSPLGNAAQRNLKLQSEYFWRDERGFFADRPYEGDQNGWYVQALYQLKPGWRVGYRRDQLDANNRGVTGTALDDLDFNPKRDSVVLDWENSEFSRVRLQYIRDASHPGESFDQFFLRYYLGIGAHRAHQF